MAQPIDFDNWRAPDLGDWMLPHPAAIQTVPTAPLHWYPPFKRADAATYTPPSPAPSTPTAGTTSALLNKITIPSLLAPLLQWPSFSGPAQGQGGLRQHYTGVSGRPTSCCIWHLRPTHERASWTACTGLLYVRVLRTQQEPIMSCSYPSELCCMQACCLFPANHLSRHPQHHLAPHLLNNSRHQHPTHLQLNSSRLLQLKHRQWMSQHAVQQTALPQLSCGA